MKKVLMFPELNRKVIIKTDSYLTSPREDFDNLGICIFSHRTYDFGDKLHGIDFSDYVSSSDCAKGIKNKLKAVVILPVYMYDHSGQTISTKPFSCKFDSGQLGFIVATRESILKEYGVTRITKKIRETVEKVLEAEIETLNAWISNDVYSFEVKSIKKKKTKDSCSGFYFNTPDNGIFDHLNIKGLTYEKYKEVFENSNFE